MNVSEQAPGAIFVMVGPGGAGKNAIMKAIISESDTIRQLATATTRAIRPDEEQGREHLFVSPRQFREMIDGGELLEYQEVTPGKLYGIPRATVADVIANGRVRMADIEVLGAKALSAEFPENIVQIFITVPGGDLASQMTLLERRMRQRADNSTDIRQRLERARSLELPYQNCCDYVVVNDILPGAIEQTRAIIKHELSLRKLLGEPA